MKLLVVISVEFMIKDVLGLFDFFNLFSDTSADESVLEPTIGSFDFSLGLRRKGISDLHIAILNDLLPLRGGLIGQEMVFIPEGISSADKSEDGVRVDIIHVRESKAKEDRLQGQNMGPTGLCLEQNGIEHESAIIIQRSDEVPLLLSGGGPEVMGGVVLDEFPDIMG